MMSQCTTKRLFAVLIILSVVTLSYILLSKVGRNTVFCGVIFMKKLSYCPESVEEQLRRIRLPSFESDVKDVVVSEVKSIEHKFDTEKHILTDIRKIKHYLDSINNHFLKNSVQLPLQVLNGSDGSVSQLLTESVRDAQVHMNVSSSASSQLDWIDTNKGSVYANYGDRDCRGTGAEPLLKQLLEKWINISSSYDIPYVLTCGALLGAFRDGNLIPYDSDLDILIDRKYATVLEMMSDERSFVETDFSRSRLIIQADWREPYEKRRRLMCNGKRVKVYSDNCSFQEPLARLIRGVYHLDVYDFQIMDGKVYDPSEGGHQFKADLIFPIKRCMFLGLEVRCPNNPQEVLETLYGKNLSPKKLCRQGKWVSN